MAIYRSDLTGDSVFVESMERGTRYIESDDAEFEIRNREYLASVIRRSARFQRLKPRKIAAILSRLVEPSDRRRVVTVARGVRLYLDPLSDLGHCILTKGPYEPQVSEILRAEIRPGEVFLDVGANEGFFSVLAASLTGPSGFVIAVEPQSRLRDIIGINFHINNIRSARIYSKALGGRDGELADLFLYSSLNTGMSGLVKKYHSSISTEKVQFISPEIIFQGCGVQQIDFVKIDVEGFEDKVVASLLPFVRAGKIRKVLLEYHDAILAELGKDSGHIHESLIASGLRMKCRIEDSDNPHVLYEMTGESDR